jgi:predicted GNAT superfamily acetyltransferase
LHIAEVVTQIAILPRVRVLNEMDGHRFDERIDARRRQPLFELFERGYRVVLFGQENHPVEFQVFHHPREGLPDGIDDREIPPRDGHIARQDMDSPD